MKKLREKLTAGVNFPHVNRLAAMMKEVENIRIKPWKPVMK